MLLAIDCGNSDTVLALVDAARGGGIVARWRTATHERRTSDDFAIWFASALSGSGHGFDVVEDVILANVVPAQHRSLEEFARSCFGVEPLCVPEAARRAGVRVRLRAPGSLGDDRLANAFGASVRYGGALVVVDFGTATTFDCVESDGTYIGGLIAPGIDLSLEALHRGTARLPRTWLSRPSGVIGDDTASALRRGIYWGYVSLVEGILRRIRSEHAYEKVIATGGQAAVLAEDLPFTCTDLDLTLHGLAALHARSGGASASARASGVG